MVKPAPAMPAAWKEWWGSQVSVSSPSSHAAAGESSSDASHRKPCADVVDGGSAVSAVSDTDTVKYDDQELVAKELRERIAPVPHHKVYPDIDDFFDKLLHEDVPRTAAKGPSSSAAAGASSSSGGVATAAAATAVDSSFVVVTPVVSAAPQASKSKVVPASFASSSQGVSTQVVSAESKGVSSKVVSADSSEVLLPVASTEHESSRERSPRHKCRVTAALGRVARSSSRNSCTPRPKTNQRVSRPSTPRTRNQGPCSGSEYVNNDIEIQDVSPAMPVKRGATMANLPDVSMSRRPSPVPPQTGDHTTSPTSLDHTTFARVSRDNQQRDDNGGDNPGESLVRPSISRYPQQATDSKFSPPSLDSSMFARGPRDDGTMMTRVSERIAHIELNHQNALAQQRSDHDVAMRRKEEELRIAADTHDHLRSEINMAKHACSVSEYNARTLHETTQRLETEVRESRNAFGVEMRNAEQRTIDSYEVRVSRSEAAAEAQHVSMSLRYRAELDEALRQSTPPTLPCPQCPIKQNRIDSMLAELGHMQEDNNGKQRRIDEMAKLIADLRANQETLQHRNDESTQMSTDLRSKLDQLTQQYTQLTQQYQQQQAARTAREAELSGHADSLSKELEHVRSQLAAGGYAATNEHLVELARKDGEIQTLVTKVSMLESQLASLHTAHSLSLKALAMPSTRSYRSSAHSHQSYNMADDEDDSGEHDDNDGASSFGPKPTTHAPTLTIPPKPLQVGITPNGAAPSSDGGKPPRYPGGGSGGGGGGAGGGSGGDSSGGNRDRANRRPTHGGGGGGGDGGGDGGGSDGPGGDAHARRDRRPRRRSHDTSDSDHPRVSRKRESDDIKIAILPRYASEFRNWMDNTVDAVTACARDPDIAFQWITRIEQPDCTFEELGVVSTETHSLDAKIRVSLSKHMTGSEAERNRELVSSLTKRRDELRKADSPMQIRGRQLIYLIRQFYQIDDAQRVSFELSALMDLEYPGDSNMGPFKDQWDFMLRHCITKLSDKDKQGILVKKLRKSDRLKPHLEYYDRCHDGHADKSYQFVSDLMDQMVMDDRKRRNNESLVRAASGKDQQPPRKPQATPGPKSTAPGVTPDPKKGKKGDGKDKKKGKPGSSSGSDSESGGSASDTNNPFARPLSEFKGTDIAEVPAEQLCCLHHCWGICKRGEKCKHNHLDKCTAAMRGTKSYARLLAFYGDPVAHKAKLLARAKAKAKAAPAQVAADGS